MQGPKKSTPPRPFDDLIEEARQQRRLQLAGAGEAGNRHYRTIAPKSDKQMWRTYPRQEGASGGHEAQHIDINDVQKKLEQQVETYSEASEAKKGKAKHYERMRLRSWSPAELSTITQRRATPNTVRLSGGHPLVENLKQLGEMYNEVVQNNSGHTMGQSHFHYMLCLLRWMAREETEKEKIENKGELDIFLLSLRKALAQLAGAASMVDNWELDMLFRKCRIQMKKAEVTSIISYDIVGSVLIDNVPVKYHSHPLIANEASSPDSRLVRIELQLVVTLLLVEHGAAVLAGPAPKGSKERQPREKEKKRR